MSTSLLDDIWTNALDPGYRAARAARGTEAAPRPRRRLAAVVVTSAALGAAVAAGATQVRENVVAGRGTKTQLISQIEVQEHASAALAATEGAERASVSAGRAKTLAQSAAGDQVAAQLAAAELASAVTPVSGPGVTVRLSDGPRGATDSSDDPARVTDVDLRQVVNALLASGADAVAVDGLRLGPRTAIRTAGSAVLVDFRPVASPYVVAAIGPANALETGYARSGAAARLQTLAGLYGITVDVAAAGDLHLAGTSGPTPAYATPLAGRS